MSKIKKIIKATLMVTVLSLNFVNAADIKSGVKIAKEASEKIPLVSITKKNALEFAEKRVESYLNVMSVKKSNVDPYLYKELIKSVSNPRSFLAILDVLAPVNKPGFQIGIIARFYDDLVKSAQITNLMSHILTKSKNSFSGGDGYLQSYLPDGVAKLSQSFARARQEGLLHGVVTGSEDIIAAIIKIAPPRMKNHTKAEFKELQEIVTHAAINEKNISPERMLNTRLFKDKRRPPTALQVEYVRSIDVSMLKSSDSILQWWRQGLGANPLNIDHSLMYDKLKDALIPIIEEKGVRDPFVSNVFIASRSNKKFTEIVEDLLNIKDTVD